MNKNVRIEGPDADGEFLLYADVYDKDNNFVLATPQSGLSFLEMWNNLEEKDKRELTLQFSEKIIITYMKNI
jgi:hypothetical protein